MSEDFKNLEGTEVEGTPERVSPKEPRKTQEFFPIVRFSQLPYQPRLLNITQYTHEPIPRGDMQELVKVYSEQARNVTRDI